MKNNRKIVNTKKAIIIITCTFIFCVFSIILCVLSMINKNTYAAVETVVEKETVAENIICDINIMDILEENKKNIYKEEYITEQKTLEYTTSYEEDVNLPKGMIQVLQEGRDGVEQITIKRTFENDELISEEATESKIIKAAIKKIVTVGTSKYTSNYKVKVGDTLYVTPDILSIMSLPEQSSEKILTIYKDSEVKLIETNKQWYKVLYDVYTGYAPSNCFTYLKPKSSLEENLGNSEEPKSKQALLANLSFNISLNKPSGLTLEQFRQVLSNNEKDRNKIFENNADYFYYIEKQYNVNGIFVAAVGIHESGWGTSKICLNKNNLFGYGAYDRSPYGSAYSYNDYSESIDLIARVFSKYYLNPAGTGIYDGQVASGAYYNGATLTGVNKKYATDKNWANAVYNWMKFLYNNL